MKNRLMFGTILVVAAATIAVMQFQVRELKHLARAADERARTLEAEVGRLESTVADQERHQSDRLCEVDARVEATSRRVEDRLTGLAGQVEARHTQIERQTRVALSHASTKFQQDMNAQVGVLRSALLDQQRTLSTQAERLATLSVPSRASAQDLRRTLIYPTVQIRCDGDIGAGAIIYSRPGPSGGFDTYVLSAYHVVSDFVAAGGPWETRDPASLRVWTAEAASPADFEADIVAYQEELDLVLLKVRSDQPFRHVAPIASREKLKAMTPFTSIYTVGCPLGHDPMPSRGEITNQSKDVNGRRFWIVSAPTIFGNSGGGVFLEDTRELVGVCSMVCVYQNLIPVPVSHMGVMVPGEAVLDWLDSQCYQFLYDPGMTKNTCDWMRAATRGVPSNALAGTWDY